MPSRLPTAKQRTEGEHSQLHTVFVYGGSEDDEVVRRICKWLMDAVRPTACYAITGVTHIYRWIDRLSTV